MVQDFLSWLGFGILMKHGVCLQDVSDRVAKNIISAQEISQAPTKADGSRELFCVSCCTRFDHHPKYVSGDPRNIAYIGKIIGLYTRKHKNVMSVSIWLV